MNLPNKLTLLRILLVPVFMVLAGMTRYGAADYQAGWYLAAGVVFALASFTDFLDGYLARKWKMVTDFGKFADPLADKLLTTVAFLYMMRDGVCSLWVVALILAPIIHLSKGLGAWRFVLASLALGATWYFGFSPVYLILVGAVGGLGWTFCLKRKGLKP